MATTKSGRHSTPRTPDLTVGDAAVASPQPTALQVRYDAIRAAKMGAGRFTLAEAAAAIAAGAAGETTELLLPRLLKAAKSHDLPTYLPGSNLPICYGNGPGEVSQARDFYEEAIWDELNDWIARTAKHVGFRFPSPALPSRTYCTGPTLTTDQMCDAFDGVGGRASMWWRLTLTKNRPAWLLAHRAGGGRQGNDGLQATWFPLRIAQALMEGKSRQHVPVADLDAAFRSPVLKHLQQDWRQIRDDHPAWGD